MMMLPAVQRPAASARDSVAPEWGPQHPSKPLPGSEALGSESGQ